MLKSKLALALPLAVLAMVGCSSSDNRFQPVEAPEIENRFALDEVWSTSTGGVSDFYSELEAAFDASNVYTASRDGDVMALSQTSGDRIWSVDLSDEPENDEKRSARLSGGVAISGNKLAVGSENGYIYLLNSADGSIAWRAYLESEVVACPTFNASGTKLFVLDSRGNFSAFDTNTGEKLWVTGDAPQALRLRAQSNPVAIGDEYLLVGTSSGRVNVILQSNGATVNQITVGEAVGSNALERVADVSGTPLVLGNVLYAASFSGSLVEYDFGTFNYLTRLGYQSSRDFGFDENSLLITSDDGTVYCLNRADNSQRWANTQLSYRNVTAPVVYGNYAVVGDYEGYVYFLDMQDGSIDYMDQVDSSGMYTEGKVKNGNLYLLARDGTLSCVRYGDQARNAQAAQVENSNDALLASAAAGLTLNHPGVFEGGIYAPTSMSAEQLEARRSAIRRAAYEEERRRQVSGFGIAPGVRAAIEDEEQGQN